MIVDQHTKERQMVIITESLYYAGSSEEILKRISAIRPLPESLSINGPYARFISKGLIKSIAIYKFHESKLLEALECVSESLNCYAAKLGICVHGSALKSDSEDIYGAFEALQLSRKAINKALK